jgi:hypothetical protein
VRELSSISFQLSATRADGVIIAGHARLLAARKLGMAEVPVIVLDHLTESQRRALVLADNKLALNAGWAEIRAGNPDLQGLCLALSDWPAELRILRERR